jgi:curved DNA-binding protein CbpA
MAEALMRDYYAVLEVLPSATADEIKRRYRQLVRENHPDIAPDRVEAHERMQSILEAYGVLGSEDARGRYDRDLAQKAEASAQEAGGYGSRRSHDEGAGSSMAMPEVVRRARAAQNLARQKDGSAGRRSRTRLLTMVFEAAQLWAIEKQPGEAIALCHRVLKDDPRNAEACALLGDIYVSQERLDLALLMFEKAMRAQPSNLLYKRKWNALRRGEPVPESSFARPPLESQPLSPVEDAPEVPAPVEPLRAKLGIADEKLGRKSVLGKWFGKK